MMKLQQFGCNKDDNETSYPAILKHLNIMEMLCELIITFNSVPLTLIDTSLRSRPWRTSGAEVPATIYYSWKLVRKSRSSSKLQSYFSWCKWKNNGEGKKDMQEIWRGLDEVSYDIFLPNKKKVQDNSCKVRFWPSTPGDTTILDVTMVFSSPSWNCKSTCSWIRWQ